jgi:hypothetical protein
MRHNKAIQRAGRDVVDRGVRELDYRKSVPLYEGEITPIK